MLDKSISEKCAQPQQWYFWRLSKVLCCVVKELFASLKFSNMLLKIESECLRAKTRLSYSGGDRVYNVFKLCN
jgi:hypothetical protein